MTREPDPTGFDAIVAAWRAEGNVPEWPDDPHLDELAADARTGVGTDARADDAGRHAADAADDPDGGRSDTRGPVRRQRRRGRIRRRSASADPARRNRRTPHRH